MPRSHVVCLLGAFSLLAGIRGLPGMQVLSQAPPGGAEFDHLIPHIEAACAIVREKPDIWHYRAFPYGPLGLEIRKAKTPAEADRTRGFFLGAAAGASGIPEDLVTGLLFPRPDAARPRVGAQWPDGRKYSIVEEVAPGVFFYETT